MNQELSNINTSMNQDKELQIAKKLAPLAEQANTLEITDQSSLKEATSILSQLNKFNDDIDHEESKVLDPLKEAMKAEKARWKPAKDYYKAGIEAIRLKMATYQTNLVNSTKEKEQKIVSRIGQGRGKLTIESAVKQIESIPQIEKETATEEGLVQFRERKQLKVTDLSLIPDYYWQINEDLLLEDLKAGKDIPGAEIEIVQVPVNFR
jgi:hypothetical protein